MTATTPESTVAPGVGGSTRGAPRVAKKIRLHVDTEKRADYWAQRAGISTNEYMANAVEDAIRRENGDYDLPQLEVQRLNQLNDLVSSLASNVENLERVVLSGFGSLLTLAMGDNFLGDAENGELTNVGEDFEPGVG